MLFRINMYRLGMEKEHEARRRVHRLAGLTFALSIDAVVCGLFLFAIVLTDRGIDARAERLGAAEYATMELLWDSPELSDEELSLLGARATHVRWSAVTRAIAELVPPEMWFTRIWFVAGGVGFGSTREPGLYMQGKLTAGRKQESLASLMEFVQSLREQPYFRDRFQDAKLASSRWSTEYFGDGLAFEIHCPLGEWVEVGYERPY